MTDVTFVILSFEGPDRYSHAGGLGSRVTALSKALADSGFETHLFFIGDPHLPGHEITENRKLHLHRWCQWISRHHPAGVYDGEEGKLRDWNHSLPAWLQANIIGQKAGAGRAVVVLGEEWQTTGSLLTLHDMLDQRGWRGRVRLLWNANNIFGFHRIPWDALRGAATITTVSRYMKHLMWGCRVDARVIPNGIPDGWLQPLDRKACRSLSGLLRDRLTLVKVARWDPDKRWLTAVDAIAAIKQLGLHPLFLARGGVESHEGEVLARAEQRGLRVKFVSWAGNGTQALVDAIRPAIPADMVVLRGFLSEAQRRVLFHTGRVVLANSGVEPFGLVGLETMAVGGVAFVGCTGEDYATNRYDAICLQTNDPLEIAHHATYLQSHPGEALNLRHAAKRTAALYTWRSVIQRVFLPTLEELGIQFQFPAATGQSCARDDLRVVHRRHLADKLTPARAAAPMSEYGTNISSRRLAR